MDVYLKRTYIIFAIFLFQTLTAVSQSSAPQQDDLRSQNRRFADSLYAVHSGKANKETNPKTDKIDTAGVMASKNNIARKFISNNR